jgi:hypothetical protein
MTVPFVRAQPLDAGKAQLSAEQAKAAAVKARLAGVGVNVLNN